MVRCWFLHEHLNTDSINPLHVEEITDTKPEVLQRYTRENALVVVRPQKFERLSNAEDSWIMK